MRDHFAASICWEINRVWASFEVTVPRAECKKRPTLTLVASSSFRLKHLHLTYLIRKLSFISLFFLRLTLLRSLSFVLLFLLFLYFLGCLPKTIWKETIMQKLAKKILPWNWVLWRDIAKFDHCREMVLYFRKHYSVGLLLEGPFWEITLEKHNWYTASYQSKWPTTQRNCRTLSSHRGQQKLSAASTMTTYPRALKIANRKRFCHVKFCTTVHDGSIAPILRRNETHGVFPAQSSNGSQTCLFVRAPSGQELSRRNRIRRALLPTHGKMLVDGHFRKISDHGAGVKPPNTWPWYLPVLAVTNPNKPGKVRLVLDAAAKSHGKSLNDFLMKGPDLFNPIPDILIRFRERRIGLTSDVTAMFSQVLVKDEDRPSLQFLWRGRRRSGRFDEYELPVVIFGARSSPAVAEYCFQRTAEEFAPSEKDVLNAVKKDTYVDDVITGADSVEDATHLVARVTEALDKSGFKLGRWSTNSEVVWQSLSPKLRSEEPVNIDIKEHTERVQGVFCSPTTDELTFRPKVKDVPATKRTVLSIVMTVYDPLGLLACWLTRARILLQGLWKLNFDWDENIPVELMTRSSNWLADLAEINTVWVKRHMHFRTRWGRGSWTSHFHQCQQRRLWRSRLLQVDWFEYQETVRTSHDGENTSRSAESLKEVRCSFYEFSKPIQFCSNLAETFFNPFPIRKCKKMRVIILVFKMALIKVPLITCAFSIRFFLLTLLVGRQWTCECAQTSGQTLSLCKKWFWELFCSRHCFTGKNSQNHIWLSGAKWSYLR